MVTERDSGTVFDYRSVFDYGPADINLKTSYRRNYYKSAFSYHAVSIPSDAEIENHFKETLPFLVLRNVITFLFYLMAIVLFPLSFWICIKRVHSLERIVLMRLGKLQPIKGPGFAFILPFVDKWIRVDLRPQSFTVSTPQLLTADGGVVEAQTDIEYRVSDVLDYVLKLRQQDSTVRDLGLACLTNIMSEKDQDDLETKRDIVSDNLKDELNRSTMNWGLEVMNVYLHSVKILKAAEPVDAIGTIMAAINAAAGTSSEHTAAKFPVSLHSSDTSTKLESPNIVTPLVNLVNKEQDDCVETIKKCMATAAREGLIKDLTGKFRFEIVGRSTRIVVLSFEKGNSSVIETADNSMKTDVQLILTEDNLRDFLNGEVSPLEAYVDGKVMVTGDWSLLRSLAKVFDFCKSN